MAAAGGARAVALALALVAIGLTAGQVRAAVPAAFESVTLAPPAAVGGTGAPAIAVDGDRVAAASLGPVLWASHDGGRTFTEPRTPAGNRTCVDLLGGFGDTAVGADGTLYAVQQCLALGGAIFIWRSTDGGRTWAPPAGGRLQAVTAGMEVAMLTADPVDPQTLYITGEALDLTTLVVWKSTDGGRSFALRGVANLPLTPDLLEGDGPSGPTRLLVDPTDRRRLYLMWWAIGKRELAQGLGLEAVSDYEFATHAFAAVSTDGGATWTARKIIDTGSPPAGLVPPSHAEYDDLANWAPAGAIGSDGTVYFAVAEQRPHAPGAHVMVMSSRDHGATWSERVRVDAGTNATFAPALAAGAAGRVGIAFLQADRSDPLDPQARWSEQYAFSDDAFAPQPRFTQSPVTGPLLTSAVCPLADGPSGCRSRMLSIDADGAGNALILGIEGSGPTSALVLSRQVAGPTLAATAASAVRPRLRLRVRPSSARAGRRTAFRFTVTSVDGGTRRPVSRARIAFAGRAARTDRRGRVTITARLRTRGTRHPRATKRGFRAGAATVRVR